MDNAARYNAPLSLHRVVAKNRYRPGGLVLASDAWLAAEEQALDRGESPTPSIEIGLWLRQFHEIDIFNRQDVVAGMITLSELEVELAVAEGFLRRKVETGELQPDHTLELGQKVYHYFDRERSERIRVQFNLTPVDDTTIKRLFLDYCREMDMAASYKPVLLLAILDCVDNRGKAAVDDVVACFRRFYEERWRAGLPVEKSTVRMARVGELDDADVRRVMLRKQTLVQRVLIGPDSFAITLYDDTGRAIAKQRLSEGEKQIFAVSVLRGLSRAAARPLPAIIDTPMARLDDKHRDKLVERYFPHASHQVIVLSTDTEIERRDFHDLQPHIARAYHLNCDDQKKLTVAEEGYFWKDEG